MNVYLVRHGDAEKSTFDKMDFERGLTIQGISITRNSANYWRKIIAVPDHIISSPFSRAEQTSQIISEVFGFDKKIITDKKLSPGSKTEDLIEILNTLKGKNIIVVGHQPDISDHISELTSDSGMFLEFKKSAIAKISFGSRVKRGKGTLEFLIPPEVFQ
jgi:phosphohistidine phosphatase